MHQMLSIVWESAKRLEQLNMHRIRKNVAASCGIKAIFGRAEQVEWASDWLNVTASSRKRCTEHNTCIVEKQRCNMIAAVQHATGCNMAVVRSG